jgi:hypothetical protein
MNDAQFQLIAAFQEARLAKALDDHLVARVDRQRETGELDRAVLEEHRAWAKKMGGGVLPAPLSAWQYGSQHSREVL